MLEAKSTTDCSRTACRSPICSTANQPSMTDATNRFASIAPAEIRSKMSASLLRAANPCTRNSAGAPLAHYTSADLACGAVCHVLDVDLRRSAKNGGFHTAYGSTKTKSTGDQPEHYTSAELARGGIFPAMGVDLPRRWCSNGLSWVSVHQQHRGPTDTLYQCRKRYLPWA